MSECTPTERAEQKYPLWLPTGDYETDCEDYSETDAAWQNAEAEMQRQAYIAGAECERAKRPDRQQIYKAIREEAKSVDSPCPPWLASRYADAVLALEPEAREYKLEQLAAVTNLNLITKAMLEEVGYPSHFHPADAPSWAYSVLEEEHEARTAPEVREIANAEVAVICRRDVPGTVPSWAGKDQIDPCRCVQKKGHDGACVCEHGLGHRPAREVE